MITLIVDDSQTMRTIIRNTLLEIGTNDSDIHEAKDGLDALEVLGNAKIELILLDWEMPKLNGFEFLKIIKSNDDLKDIPVVMITTLSGRKEVVAALKLGVFDYIVKPFDAETLQFKIDILIDVIKLS